MKIKKSVSNFEAKSAVAGLIVAGSISSAHAALPEPAQAAVDSIILFANDMIDIAWPILTLILGATVGIKLFKKFVNKVT